jgi:hypothetical protein
MRVGLHNHSCYSDGRLSPAQLVAQGAVLGYECLALTDHNTTAGWQSLGALPDWVAPGIELSVRSDDGVEVHLLGLWLEPRGPLVAHARAFTEVYSRAWREGMLQATGDPALADLAADPLTRAQAIDHLCRELGPAQALRAWVAGHTAIEQHRPPMPHWCEGLAWLRECGATVGLAHPQRYGPLRDLEAIVQTVDAVEVIHPTHSEAHRLHWQAEARRFGKACWGSHDYHGWSGYQQQGLPEPVTIDALR